MRRSKSSLYTKQQMSLLVFGIFVLLLAVALFLGIYYGKKSATETFQKASVSDKTTQQTEAHDQNSEGEDNVDVSSAIIVQNGIQYVSLEGLGAEITKLSDSVYQAKLSEEDQYVFCTQTFDYFHNKKLGLLNTLPIVSGERLFIPISASFENLSKSDAKKMVQASVGAANTAPALPQTYSELDYFSEVLSSPAFRCDLSEYEPYLNPTDRDGYLILLNANHGVDKNFRPENLIPVERARYSGADRAMMVETAAKSLDAFLREAYAQGNNDITVPTAFRSYSNQESRFNIKVGTIRAADPSLSLEEAQNEAARYIQWPGKSEHQTGLACDMHNLPAASTDFGGTPEADWLAENAHHFGFILRYPADKTDVTGITYEPWHFRYVGRYHATRMYLLNLTLEEYTDFLTLTGMPA